MGNESSLFSEPTAKDYTQLSRETQFTEDELRGLWTKFQAVGSSQVRDGRIDAKELQLALGLTNEGFAKRVFQAFDRDSENGIDFNEFVRGVSAMSPRATIAQKAQFCFRVYDSDQNGVIDREELRSILTLSLVQTQSVKMTGAPLNSLIDGMYNKIDQDGNGKISYAEFEAEARKNPSILTCVEIQLDTLLKSHSTR
jgi:Ca2+-binding EF-hand superfamily protein